MNKNLEIILKQINYWGEYSKLEMDLELILNPLKNITFLKYLKSIGIVTEKFFAIKVGNNYFPRMFKTISDAYDFGRLGEENENLTFEEKIFMYFNKFEMFSVEEI
jgi:hypothetical protein